MTEEAQAMLAEVSAEERLVAQRAAEAFAEYLQAFAEKRLQEKQHSAGAPLGEPREVPPETVRLSVEELLARAEANRGSALSSDARLRAAGARREAAEAEARFPELMVGLGYWQDPRMRPGIGVTASMSLPSLWGPGRDRIHQAQEEEAAERAARDSVRVDAQGEVTEAHASARRLLYRQREPARVG